MAAEGVRFPGNQAVDLRTLDLDPELSNAHSTSNSDSNSTSNSGTQTLELDYGSSIRRINRAEVGA